MIITAGTLSLMFALISKDQFFEEALHKYLSDKNERDEFRQELHLTILEMPKALEYWNTNCFKWIYLGIIKNSICSNNSRWHYKYRKRKYELFDDIEGFQIEDLDLIDEEYNEEEKELLKKNKINLVGNIISEQIKLNPLLVREFQLFNMYYRGGLTYRAISAQTKIPLKSCHTYIKNAKDIIKNEIQKLN